MRYTGLLSRLRALEAQLGPQQQTLRVVGGLPPGYAPPNPPPKEPEPKPKDPPETPGSLS
jgi:hypothetical protein